MKYPEISKELIQMRAADYALRGQWRDKSNDPSWNKQVKELDQANTTRLKEIVHEIGWPTISAVGAKASDAAWLLVQHSDHDLGFQLECLDLMKQQTEAVSPLNIAYLLDRTLVAQGKPQKYGTQLYRPGGKGEHIPQPIRDPDGVDARRLALGLSTMAEYCEMMNRH